MAPRACAAAASPASRRGTGCRTPPLPPSSPIQPRQAPGPRPASQSKTLQLLAAARRARGLPERPFSQLGDAGMWLARSFRPAFGCDGRLARPVVGRGAFFVEIKRVRTTDADPEPALNAALAHLLPEAEAAPQELPSRALPACPAYDDDLYAASAARAAVAKAVHAYGKAHAGRLREAFELVGALWLHDATATHVERPTVASAWARELRRAARDDAVGSWLAARARAEVRNTGDGVRAAFLHLARHDVAAAAKACAAAGRTRARLPPRRATSRIPIPRCRSSSARPARSRRRPAARTRRSRRAFSAWPRSPSTSRTMLS